MLTAARLPHMFDIRRPLTPTGSIVVGLAVLCAGAAYCMGYSVLSGGTNEWTRALSWSAGAVLPWLVAFEWIKRRGTTAWPSILLTLAATGLLSLGIEGAIGRLIWAKSSSPVALQLLRRLPAISVVALLLALRGAGRGALSAGEIVPVAATDLRYVRAADNYVELHFPGRMEMQRETLARMEKRLAGQGFVRVHRSLLVHPRSVVRIEAGGRTPLLILDDGTRLPTGERYRTALRHFVP
jgi:hypothetical protein